MFTERGQCTSPVRSRKRLVVVLQRPFHLGTDVLVVINDQQLGFCHRPLFTGRLTRNVLPFPASLSALMLPHAPRRSFGTETCRCRAPVSSCSETDGIGSP